VHGTQTIGTTLITGTQTVGDSLVQGTSAVGRTLSQGARRNLQSAQLTIDEFFDVAGQSELEGSGSTRFKAMVERRERERLAVLAMLRDKTIDLRRQVCVGYFLILT